MKIFINLIMLIAILFTVGCNKKKLKPVVEQNIDLNQSIVEENTSSVVVAPPIEIAIATEVEEPIIMEEPIIEEPEYDAYTAYYNDEVILDGVASKIIVLKSKKVMVLLDENENVLSRHRISLGKNDIGTKLKQGDYKTPEGVYNVVNKRSDKKYYKQISISYPNHEDRERSKSLGFNPGGGITIHAQVPWNWNGERNDYTLSKNWTQGCIAMTNEGIDMIWNNISPQTLVDIRE